MEEVLGWSEEEGKNLLVSEADTQFGRDSAAGSSRRHSGREA